MTSSTRKMATRLALVLALGTMISTTAILPALATTNPDQVADLAHRWAKVTYHTPADQQEAAFKALADDAATLAQQNSANAALLGWQGIILSSYAGAKGGLGALDIAKQARTALQQAAQIDEKALGGGIDTSLGVLYHKVPGWPLGFGNDDQARALLERGLALNPDGIDENYFYGDFLLDMGKKKEARQYLEKAAAAAPRPGREDADAGRHQDIASDLAKL
jgi:tetratricopeptide (TPR) repeat protein